MTLLAISFHGTRMSTVRSLWKEGQSTATARMGSEPYAGGTFVVYDWDQDQVTWQIDVDGASGFCWRQELLYINMVRVSETLAVDGHGRERKRFSHRFLNNVHTLVPTRRGFLLTSTGTDSIVEVDQDGAMLYEWCALDHGYHLLKNHERRVLDRAVDQRYVVYPTTSSHATHVNAAFYRDPEESCILATLFHQGTVIAIDRASGAATTVFAGLSAPHDLRPFPGGGWIVSDTGNNQTLLLSEDWQVRRRIVLGFDWVQSSAPLADGSIIIADTNHHRLVRVSAQEEQPMETRIFPPDWRIFLVRAVPPAYQQFFQHPIAAPPL